MISTRPVKKTKRKVLSDKLSYGIDLTYIKANRCFHLEQRKIGTRQYPHRAFVHANIIKRNEKIRAIYP